MSKVLSVAEKGVNASGVAATAQSCGGGDAGGTGPTPTPVPAPADGDAALLAAPVAVALESGSNRITCAYVWNSSPTDYTVENIV